VLPLRVTCVRRGATTMAANVDERMRCVRVAGETADDNEVRECARAQTDTT